MGISLRVVAASDAVVGAKVFYFYRKKKGEEQSARYGSNAGALRRIIALATFTPCFYFC